jgi:hypothetical protein
MKKIICVVALSLSLLSVVGCTFAPFPYLIVGTFPPIPYLRRVPQGISRISVSDIKSGQTISDANVRISYYQLKNQGGGVRPEVFTIEPVESFIWTNRSEKEQRINVKRSKREDFNVIGRIELVSFQSHFGPAMPGTLYSDYAVYVAATAEGYKPLTLSYFCVNPPKGELKTKEGATATLKTRGVLEIKLKKKTSPLP